LQFELLNRYGPAKIDLRAFHLTPQRVRFGSPLELHFELHARADAELMIDYAVHHKKANGSLSPKVFKWTTRSVRRGETITLDKPHPIRAQFRRGATTRGCIGASC